MSGRSLDLDQMDESREDIQPASAAVCPVDREWDPIHVDIRSSLADTDQAEELNSTPVESMTKALRDHGSIVEIIRNGRVRDARKYTKEDC
ncbi:hypothetical protein N7492_000094 [Penicillium capsulatum]|uniref:Uncharacterized protein n=1 Tax=Penicillium capsulatum TaxID=69766 RepID=A0A9W9IQM3_9EURO|nr:hypothetical protein N7492_000094 [Penicillium capsulatum]